MDMKGKMQPVEFVSWVDMLSELIQIQQMEI